MANSVVVTEGMERLFGILTKPDAPPHVADLKTQFGRGRFDDAMKGLLDAGLAKHVNSSVGGGTLHRDVKPEATSIAKQIDAVNLYQSEQDLYAPLVEHLPEWAAGKQFTEPVWAEDVSHAGKRTGRDDTHPDLALAGFHEAINPGADHTHREVHLVTFEVKPRDVWPTWAADEAAGQWDVTGGNASHLMIHVPAYRRPDLERRAQIIQAAQHNGVGLIEFADPTKPHTWTEVVAVQPRELDGDKFLAFLATNMPKHGAEVKAALEGKSTPNPVPVAPGPAATVTASPEPPVQVDPAPSVDSAVTAAAPSDVEYVPQHLAPEPTTIPEPPVTDPASVVAIQPDTAPPSETHSEGIIDKIKGAIHGWEHPGA